MTAFFRPPTPAMVDVLLEMVTGALFREGPLGPRLVAGDPKGRRVGRQTLNGLLERELIEPRPSTIFRTTWKLTRHGVRVASIRIRSPRKVVRK